ncbi:lytic murein transglycosylase [Marinovum sp. 2_MG-2023]|uniref:lytic murein transglycosylase n=1 Tax=unclassified Marinovum TaxID=2647166 RepID=UPI0026E1C829|nr:MULTISPECIES: lytic murein transglycosylase [unclassified Marinovum]MDO6728656.1 lytic murein transglycosylase [Marinovum sp. 2_MG-2023]MDO6777928.1 lytic murein transglycosylase [Marinovum sp. 1_MG-2023]
MAIFRGMAALGLCMTLATPAFAQSSCGGSFSQFIKGLKSEAASHGHTTASIDRFFSGVRQDSAVLRADKRQGVFQIPFVDFARRLISQNRINNGQTNGRRFDAVFDRMEQEFGVSRGVLLAFWAFETDYGQIQGDFNTLNALVTLAHDCRRPELFRPQIFAALELFERGAFDPATTTGAWAGEIGMVQMLPEDILTNGVDGDGDGLVTLKTSAPDALLSGANMLRDLGWRANEPWLQEVTVPGDLDWSLTGLDQPRSTADWAAMGVQVREGRAADLPAALVLPQGRKGPAFFAYPNFNVYFEWNKSFVYVMTAAYFANRLEGSTVFNAGNPEPGLSGDQMKALQRKLQAMGYDVGEIDGILGSGTRHAVQEVQKKLGMPADAWPTPALLNRL